MLRKSFKLKTLGKVKGYVFTTNIYFHLHFQEDLQGST